MSIALFITFFILILIGIPISFCLAISSVVAVVFFSDIPVINLMQKMFRGVDSFTLMAIPFFIFAGNIMARGGVSKKLTDLAAAFVGKMTGGLAVVSTVACTFFGALSGSGPATTAAIGAVMVEPMKERGYSKEFAAATVASSGTIGLLIPPSNNMVLYGAIAGASIAKMFLGGIVPGILMAIALISVELWISKKRGYRGGEAVTAGGILTAFKNGIWALLMPVLILGGIYGGIFTPTEAAAVAVIYGFVIGMFVYRLLDFKQFIKVTLDSAKGTASIMYLVASAHMFSYLLTSEQIPQKFAQLIVNFSDNLLVIQLIMMVALLVTGTFLDNAVAVILLTPIFYPVIQSMNGDLVYFGVLLVFALAIGQITPPVGLCMFVACDVAKVSIEKLTKQIIPFIAVLLLTLLILNLFPVLVTYIPSISGL
ncbi:TRAP transporter large permease [Petroclostridium sp. X23]|uniref:TRAP transporter large permease n=1 Tax=Petroclostridium sp. X23 TaxID=3045146 RepID=UPI0024ADEAA3|nr:TRAP transporter large permease [Petroclostridium sp. X23]WHH57834.1 TRAP transporter large permease [Petroclostridium sp. X23]